MNVLLTGAFGNVGQSTLEALLKQGHTIRCFDVHTRTNARVARRFRDRVDVVWGDLRRPAALAAAVEGQDAVIHLAFIIPKLSSTGFESEDHPDWAHEINVGGTHNLIAALKAQPRLPRLLFASSYHIYGRTQHMPPPRRVDDPVQPIEHYARHKVEAEGLIRASGLEWAIFRLAAVLPIAMRMDPGMFDVPLDNRMEYIHTRDAGLAFARAVDHAAVWGQTWHIGGGPRCQYTYREITDKVLTGFGLGPLPAEAFSTISFPTDWLDTTASQQLLGYQRHTLDDYVTDMQKRMGFRRHLVRVFRSLVRYWLLKQSPYLGPGQPGRLAALLAKIKMLKNPPEIELQ